MLKLVLSTWACELSIKQPPNAFPLNRSISFVFFITSRGGDWKSTRGGFHESNHTSQEQSKERAARWRPCESGLDWRRAGGTLHTQVQRERFPTCKPPTDTQRQNWSSPTHLDLADSCRGGFIHRGCGDMWWLWARPTHQNESIFQSYTQTHCHA